MHNHNRALNQARAEGIPMMLGGDAPLFARDLPRWQEIVKAHSLPEADYELPAEPSEPEPAFEIEWATVDLAAVLGHGVNSASMPASPSEDAPVALFVFGSDVTAVHSAQELAEASGGDVAEAAGWLRRLDREAVVQTGRGELRRAEAAPLLITFVRLFNGEERSSFDVPATREGASEGLGRCAFGEGWGARIRGTEAAFGALRAAHDDLGWWITVGDRLIECEVER